MKGIKCLPCTVRHFEPTNIRKTGPKRRDKNECNSIWCAGFSFIFNSFVRWQSRWLLFLHMIMTNWSFFSICGICTVYWGVVRGFIWAILQNCVVDKHKKKPHLRFMIKSAMNDFRYYSTDFACDFLWIYQLFRHFEHYDSVRKICCNLMDIGRHCGQQTTHE